MSVRYGALAGAVYDAKHGIAAATISAAASSIAIDLFICFLFLGFAPAVTVHIITNSHSSVYNYFAILVILLDK